MCVPYIAKKQQTGSFMIIPMRATQSISIQTGELCVNTALDGSKGYYVDWTDCKVAIKDSDGKQCTFSVTGQKEEPAENPTKEDYTVESKAVFENGKWLLGEMIY